MKVRVAGDMMWLWMWKFNLPGEPEVCMDSERSGTANWRLSEAGDDSGITHRIYYDISRLKLAQLTQYMILPYQEVAIVRGEALAEFQKLSASEVGFHDVTLVCKDGECDDFVVARPKLHIACTDIEKSDIKWIRQNEFYTRWKNLQFVPNCMAGHNFAREKYNRCMIVSDDFKTVLERIDPRGVAFTNPNGSRSGFADWVT